MRNTAEHHTKDRVLSELQRAGGHIVSGENLASLCGVSRTAIWKAIASLKAEGVPVHSAANKGYCIDPANDLLSHSEICALLLERGATNSSANSQLSPPILPDNITVFNEIDSTNSYARRLLADGKKLHRCVIISDRQTTGRGRMGRPFISPAGCGLYFTLVFSPKNGVTDPARYTTGAALAVCRTISLLFGAECGIKWVNDIFLGGKKICGILSEGSHSLESGSIDAIVTGIGINVREPPEGFPAEIRDVAGAVTNLFPPACPSRNRIAAELIYQLLRLYENETEADFAEYKRRSLVLGKTIEVFPLAGFEGSRSGAVSHEKSYTATALDIDAHNGLVVRTANGAIKTLRAGEVRLNSSQFTEKT
jgi:BirA family biotin operon repressor/biotin-[acetyl-CoA-carboxylase] ligase